MPIIHEIQRKHTHLIVWELTESTDEMLHWLKLSPPQLTSYKSLTIKRKREYLGIHACFKYLKRQGDILYDSSGKPYIKSNHHISISHSWGKIAFVISKFNVGIDIEKDRPLKVSNIQHKFVRSDEHSFINPHQKNDYLHIIWCIKESLYKLHEGNFWSFLNHYRAQAFELDTDQTVICEVIDQEHHTQYYTAYFTTIKDNFHLVYVLDNIL